MEWLKNIVNGLIETYGTKNVYELISSLGITLIKKDLNNNEKARFFRDAWGNEYIYISSNLDEFEEKYILAHELGHAILHTHISSEYYYSSFVSKDKLEYQANKFAAELLINEEELDMPELKNMTINQLACYLGLPKELIEYKFNI